MNLIEGLQSEMNRVREIVEVYESLPKNAGAFAAIAMKFTLESAAIAINTGDTVAMIKCLKDLKSYEL